MMENKQKKVREQLFREAFEQLTLASSKQVEAAEYYLGELWEFGEGVDSVNLKRAVEHYDKSSKSEYPRAYFKLAQL